MIMNPAKRTCLTACEASKSQASVYRLFYRPLLLAGYLFCGILWASESQLHLQPLQQGKWPLVPRGTAWSVEIKGNYAYVAIESGGLAILDISNPAAPVRVGSYNTSGSACGVAVMGNYAYVADGSAGLQVIDVSNPANPVRVGGCETDWYAYGYAYDVAVAGNYAYVADGYDGLQIIDVSNPTNCVRVGGYYTGGIAGGVTVMGNYAYVADWNVGLQVIDVSNPRNCWRVGGITGMLSKLRWWINMPTWRPMVAWKFLM